ncbi:amino acid ABC transporter ATP-binding/permease protein [Bifidobacterium mellis]|uniref:ABC transporter, permease/ATP binding protein n=1 Tax=Bifidobacterium mellis TaxID=1293823 RepID=A0A0F4L0Z6_9BIFI|nr:ABC transporter ATP-binding protein [Bifidobacterium mellis]KJY52355.1 ABC transporter, permease/ATP binding protein [Bifidobacterium mellis]
MRTGSDDMQQTTSNLMMMRRMAQLMKPLAGTEGKAILCGSLGHLFAVWSMMAAAAALIGLVTDWPPLSGQWVVWALVAVLTALSRGVMAYGEQYYNHEMAFSMLRDIRTTVFDKMRSLAPAGLRDQARGDMVTVITNDIELLEIFYAHTLSPIAIALVTSLANLALLTWLSPWMGLAALVSYLIVGLLIPILSARPTFKGAMRERTAQANLHSLLLETLQGRAELAGLGALGNTRRRVGVATDQMLDARGRTSGRTITNDMVTNVVTLICAGAFTLMACWLGSEGLMDPARGMIGLVGFLSSFAPLIPVARLGAGLQPTLAAARRVFSLLDKEPPVREVESNHGNPLSEFTGENARAVSFSYAGKTDTGKDDPGKTDSGEHSDRTSVLEGLDLSIKPGELIGIQGANGVGKSTLIDLLMRFQERSGGDLTVSGLPIETIRTADLRAQQTLVSQDTYIFSLTLADNIALARPDASREDIEKAAHDACLDDLIDQLPDGLDHLLADNGSDLSEGQRQRVALARAFLSSAPFMLLDEPTSNMDALLEGRVLTRLIERKGDRTCLIVSHRPSVLARADRLLTLQNGKLIPA